MKLPGPALSVNIDMTNPGHFFACCGLLELASRLWPDTDTEGWFDTKEALFNLHAGSDGSCTLNDIMSGLVEKGIEGELSANERAELQALEVKKRKTKKLPKQDEDRRSLLGKRQREGALTIGRPFNIRVAWWQEDSDDIPKTFAGKQEVLRMALAMLREIPKAVQADRPLEYRCLLQAVKTKAKGPSGPNHSHTPAPGQEVSKVEPFYLDAKRYAHKLDVGFSLDVQEKTIRASAAPLTELLALIGLQRFRPQQTQEDKWAFDYFTWSHPLDVIASAAVACGAVPIAGLQRYRFRLRFRDDQKRYKALGHSIRAGGISI